MDLMSDLDFFPDDDLAQASDAEPFDELLFSMDDDSETWLEDELGDDDSEDDIALEDEEFEEYDLTGMSSSDTVGLYLKEMARVPLLSTEEEISLAMRLEAGQGAA